MTRGKWTNLLENPLLILHDWCSIRRRKVKIQSRKQGGKRKDRKVDGDLTLSLLMKVLHRFSNFIYT